ncbi:NAD(P)-dependent oxidoreductase [Bradyrhizobium sp. sBnM-33]|uniref:NAD(P)-dependent oxidoreductase n=1 Tax=Bradyrhizobium sp. sBnM-33 TaxID=2831780 RepID=UPI0024BE6C7E|nr:NAD(P)-dependent oxidoreductase [Bradyrhizobium sp. sBnM-33]WOH52445.1 NAD(P)-dependent oxidoreductase [Bradyrhizobium sp. sBnM-33]
MRGFGPCIDELHSVLAKCDYVVVATPNTVETNQLIGKAEIAAMKPSACQHLARKCDPRETSL